MQAYEIVYTYLIIIREQLHRCVSHFMFNTKQMLFFVLSTVKVMKTGRLQIGLQLKCTENRKKMYIYTIKSSNGFW